MPFADLSTGARLHYDDTGGDKPPMILVHGRLSLPEIDFESIIEWLQPTYRMIGPTLRGYGQSEPKPRRFPMDFYHQDARDVLAFMDALNVPRAHIMGYSDGGEVALVAAGLAPERFTSVMVWGAVGYFGPAMRPWVQRNYPATWMTDEDKRLHDITNPDGFALEWVQAMKAMIDAGGDVSLSLAPQITAPVLLMLGDQDRLNPREYGQNFVDQTPNGQLVMFSCGHAVQDQAWPEFQRVVGDFLREVD